MRLAILAVVSLLFSSSAYGGESRDQKKNRVVPTGGIATPVGYLGLVYERMLKKKWGVEAGVGTGHLGEHLTLNTRRYLGSGSFRGNFLFGSSYSAGRDAVRASGDDNGDGKVGYDDNIPDAFWLNIASGFDLTNDAGIIWGMDFGITVPVVTGVFRPEDRGDEGEGFCDMLCLKAAVRRGHVSPSLTLLRFGYAL